MWAVLQRADSARRAPLVRRSGIAPAFIAKEEPVQAWRTLSRGLRRPFPAHSPFQQALRRRVLDALEDSPNSQINIEHLAHEFRMPLDVAYNEYRQLQTVAQTVEGISDSDKDDNQNLNLSEPG
jgi:hypothetical protein